MSQSVLSLASFEKTTDHLYEAAFHARTTPIKSVSPCARTAMRTLLPSICIDTDLSFALVTFKPAPFVNCIQGRL